MQLIFCYLYYRRGHFEDLMAQRLGIAAPQHRPTAPTVRGLALYDLIDFL
jgi:hypothetical protein